MGRLINVQFKAVNEFEDMAIICKEIDDLTRQLKVEFDCVCENLDEHKYPPFIRRLESNTVYEELHEYNYLIIELLKLMLFRIGHSDAQRLIENQFKEFLIALIEKHEPPQDLKREFKDKKQPSKPVDFKALMRQQVDITIDG